MDQEAFRALLKTPSHPDPSSQRSNQRSLALGSGSTHKSTNKLNPSGSSSYKPATPSSLKPRKFTPKESDGTNRGGYRDRASERRQGLDGDFAEAEHLLKDFQARVTAAGSQIDKDTLEQQTKYLGGDERHTILVKGLDHALLERRKAELSQGGKLGQVTDDDLETAYEQNAKQSSSTHPTTLSSTASTKQTNKKNRDELLAQLKESRDQQPADLVVVEKLKAAGKFKPIGFTSTDPNPQESHRSKEHKRRKAEKKKKKKAKAEPTTVSSTSQSDPSVSKNQLPVDAKVTQTSPVEENIKSGECEPPKADNEEPVDKKKALSSPGIPPLVKETVQIEAPVEDDDFDIFGDAGEYKGLDEASSEEEDGDGKIKGSESPPKIELGPHLPQGSKKRKTYFEDDEVESDSNSEKARKLESLEASSKKPIEPSHRTNDQETMDESINEGDHHHQDSNQVPRLTKLEGLSGSTDIKSILAADAMKEKEEKRKAKKQKNKSAKILTDKDRLNRDYLEMERFLQRKKNSDTPPPNPSKEP